MLRGYLQKFLHLNPNIQVDEITILSIIITFMHIASRNHY